MLDSCVKINFSMTWSRHFALSEALCVLLLIAAVVSGCKAQDIHIKVGEVSADARDEGPAIRAPTIADAFEFVRQDGERRKVPVTYRIDLPETPQLLDRPLTVLNIREPSRVVVAGAPGGTRISGGIFVQKFLRLSASSSARYIYALPLADLAGEQTQALLRSLATVSPKQFMFRANGKLVLQPTRWPSSGFIRALDINADPQSSVAIVALAGLPADVQASNALWIGGYLTDPYLFVNARALGVDSRGISIERRRLRQDGIPPDRIYLYNLKAFPQCNSFYYDSQNRTLNFCTEEPITSLELPILDTLLTISGSKNLTFTNVIFELSVGTAVSVRDSTNINFSNVVLQLAGGDGFAYAASFGSTIDHATIRTVGGRGAWLSGGDRMSLTRGELAITDSKLQDFSLVSRTYAPAVQVDGVGVTVRRNLIFNGPHSGIIFSGNDHLFEDNVMAQLVTEAGDSGFIYSGRDFTSQGTIIRRNVLLGTGVQYLHEARGIYLDEFSSGNHVSENIIVGVPYGILMNGGKDNELLSNLFVLSSPSIWSSALGYAAWWQNWRNDHMQIPNGASVKNLYRLPVEREPWTSRYPKLESYKKSDLLKPERNLISGNKFLGSGSIVAFDENMPMAELRSNDSITYQGSLQLLESLRNWIQLSDIRRTLELVGDELERHGLNEHVPLRLPNRIGADLSSDRALEFSRAQ